MDIKELRGLAFSKAVKAVNGSPKQNRMLLACRLIDGLIPLIQEIKEYDDVYQNGYGYSFKQDKPIVQAQINLPDSPEDREKIFALLAQIEEIEKKQNKIDAIAS